ncbi:hypothetical protein C8T65DRAFT_833368 [Cerioporus squamosus]|nr:hypothetical protein C8T65DRAFT_833368 [Cerioporus squamosus]
MMSFVETNTTTLGLGISFDSSDSFSSSPSISSSPGSPGSLFSDVAHASSASEGALGDSSDEDNFTVYSDDDMNIFYVDRRELVDQQTQVTDCPTSWKPQVDRPRAIRKDSLELYQTDSDAMGGYESDADDQLDELLWRRCRAKRRRASRSCVRFHVEDSEPTFEMVTPFPPAEQAATTTPKVPTPHSIEDDQHVDEAVRDVNMEEPQEFAHETEFSRLMGEMDMPSDSDSDYEEFYSSDEEPPRPKRVHYTSEQLEVTWVDPPAMTEQQVTEVRRGYALGLPMEDMFPITYTYSTPFNAVAHVSPASNNACSSEEQSSTSTSDSMETIDLNTDGDEGQVADGHVAQYPSAASNSAPALQLGPFCVLEGPLVPIAGPMLCSSPISEKRRRSLEKSGLLPTE